MKNSAIRRKVRRIAALERFHIMSFDQYTDTHYGQDYLSVSDEKDWKEMRGGYDRYVERKTQERDVLKSRINLS